MAKRHRVLVVDDDPNLLRTMQVLLEGEERFAVRTATSGELALELLDGGEPVDIVLTDLSMPGMDGLELLRRLRDRNANLPVIVLTAYGSVASAVEAMRLGAFQYLAKPVDPDELLVQVDRALDQARILRAHRELRERTGDPERFDRLVGNAPAMRELRAAIERVAAVDSTVLLLGETGTGKELAARLVHAGSARRGQPFVTVNCTAIPGELLESELFGHERGAFTGATRPRRGRIEEAEGGTLFLDEIGDMPLSLQPKILRFLQERTVRRVGADRERTVNVRIVAATHRDLAAAMDAGEFRRDLYYRLAAVPLRLPPLREHPEDLSLLCEHLVEKIARRLGRPPARVGDDALRLLAGYSFPGNVRELENLLERALVLGTGSRRHATEIRAEDFPALAAPGEPLLARPLPLEDGFRRLTELARRLEEDLLRRAVRAWPHLPNAEIAARLGTNRRVLELRLKQYGIVKRKG